MPTNFFSEKIKILFKILKFNYINIINNYNFLKLFNKKNLNKKKIKLKFGIDPTYKNIHFGHIFYFAKIVQYSKFDKIIKIIIVLGIITCLVNNNKYLFYLNNIKYILYILKYLLKKIKNFLKIYYNNEWSFQINIKEKIFLISLIKHDFLNFKKYENNLINFYYIFFQTYDSLFLKTDIEIGGLDQKVNFLFCKIFLFNFFKIRQFYFLFPILLKNSYEKFSKSKKDNFFNFKKLKKIIFKINNKILLINFFKLLIFKNVSIFKYINKNIDFFFMKKMIYKEIFLKFNKKYFFYLKKNNLFNKKKYKIYFFSIVIFKLILFLKILKNKNYFLKNKLLIINNINIYNKNFLIFKGNYFFKNKNINIKVI